MSYQTANLSRKNLIVLTARSTNVILSNNTSLVAELWNSISADC